MKLGPVTKPDKGNKTLLKKLTMTSRQKIVTFCHYSDLWQIWNRLDSGLIVCKAYIFSLTVSFYLTKVEDRTKESLT